MEDSQANAPSLAVEKPTLTKLAVRFSHSRMGGVVTPPSTKGGLTVCYILTPSSAGQAFVGHVARPSLTHPGCDWSQMDNPDNLPMAGTMGSMEGVGCAYVGLAQCSLKDNFSRSNGRLLAFARAYVLLSRSRPTLRKEAMRAFLANGGLESVMRYGFPGPRGLRRAMGDDEVKKAKAKGGAKEKADEAAAAATLLGVLSSLAKL